MNITIHRPIVAVVIAGIIALAAWFDAGTAQAQCNTVTLVNNTTCTLRMMFVATSGVTILVPSVPPGVSTQTFPVSFFAFGVITAIGNFFPFPPVAGPCTPCLTFNDVSSATCCVTICQPTPCTLVLNPVSPCLASCS